MAFRRHLCTIDGRNLGCLVGVGKISGASSKLASKTAFTPTMEGSFDATMERTPTSESGGLAYLDLVLEICGLPACTSTTTQVPILTGAAHEHNGPCRTRSSLFQKIFESNFRRNQLHDLIRTSLGARSGTTTSRTANRPQSRPSKSSDGAQTPAPDYAGWGAAPINTSCAPMRL